MFCVNKATLLTGYLYTSRSFKWDKTAAKHLRYFDLMIKRSQEELASEFSACPQLSKRHRISRVVDKVVSQQHQQLTHESLCKLDQHSQPFSPISPLAMSSTSRASDISDVMPLRPETSRIITIQDPHKVHQSISSD
jgi:hypothetical protein